MKCKYKVGDKVKIRSDLEIDMSYKDNRTGAWEAIWTTAKNEYLGQIVTITHVDTSDCSYRIANFDEYFSEVMFEGLASEVSSQNVNINIDKNTFKDITNQLKDIASKMNERNLYDDAIQDVIINKVKKLSIENITEDIKLELNNYIRNTFGILPKKIEITNNGKKKEISGIFHKKFDEILNIVNKGIPLMLTGPAGSGKNHTLEQIAQALDLEFYFTNAVTQEYKLTGFIDANGVYQETQFYKAFKDGGLFFLDEVDASVPEALIILNSAIANGYFDFPCGKVQCNKNFRVVCAGNTFGTGADMVYVGRNALDGATLDRFVTIQFDYDEEVEQQLAYDNDLYTFIKELRSAIKEASLRYIVSMRATINASKMLEIGIDINEILKTTIVKNMSRDDLNVIVKKINGSGKWFNAFKELANGRN